MSMAHRLFLRRILDGIDPAFTNTFLPWVVRNPRYLRAALRLGRSYQSAEKRRAQYKEIGLQVPSVMILSVTSTCNLVGAGCYAASTRTTPQPRETETESKREMNLQKWRSVIKEAKDLGIFGFVIAGGEPFLCEGIIDLCMEFKDLFFLVVTNGTSIPEEDFEKLRKASNIAIVVSLEGNKTATDARRGIGVHKQAISTLKHLWSIGVLTGVSATITRENVDFWMNTKNLDRLVQRGVRIGVFIEYIPTPEPSAPSRQSLSPCSDQGNMLTIEEREQFREHVVSYRSSNPIFLLHSPNDEEFFGGCVSAGRGFVHVTPAGDLTACPVSNLATHNLHNSSLKSGLASPLFSKIRENGHILEDHDLPCALLSHHEEVLEIARSVGAYHTDTREDVSRT
ncbi:MAG: radical SAM/SPASM domain-containing protein [Candidatus Thorarchaeota archaeon]|jgi:MoaA/NifB/PqqE/SkfB family radical SAM enzyme